MFSAEKETFEERFLSRAELVFSLLWDALPIILPLATTTLFTISTMQSEKWTGLWFRFGLGVTVLTVLVQLVQRPPRRELLRELKSQRRRREHDAARYSKILDDRSAELTDAIGTLARRMAVELGVDTTTTRVTVFRHRNDSENEDGMFVLVARYSLNPRWAKVKRDKQYSASYGAIAATWCRRFLYKDDYPADPDKWVKYVTSSDFETARMPREVAEGVRMKSVCVAGTRLEHDHHNVGVIIIETVKPWIDEALKDRIAEESGGFATLRSTVAEIIYIMSNSFSDADTERENGEPDDERRPRARRAFDSIRSRLARAGIR